MSDRKDEFIDAVIEVYKKYGLSIGHEDSHGAFLIEPLSETNVEWLRQAWMENVE